MNIVYAIVSGEYSDYHVERIFARRDDAEAYIAAMGPQSSYAALDIEEFDYHPPGCVPTIYTRYNARVWPDRCLEIEQTSERTTTEPVHTPIEQFRPDWSFIGASGPDRERVLKSVSDRLAKWKAQREGIA
jgi:hypothetical protein